MAAVGHLDVRDTRAVRDVCWRARARPGLASDLRAPGPEGRRGLLALQHRPGPAPQPLARGHDRRAGRGMPGPAAGFLPGATELRTHRRLPILGGCNTWWGTEAAITGSPRKRVWV